MIPTTHPVSLAFPRRKVSTRKLKGLGQLALLVSIVGALGPSTLNSQASALSLYH